MPARPVRRAKSVVDEARQIALASELIELGARMQVLEGEIRLPRERLLKLYKEIVKKSPPKGMLPFSVDWFMTWQPNIHATLFMNIHRHLIKSAALEDSEALIRAYRLYREQINQLGLPEVLSVTRAWRLVRFFDANMLTLTACTRCTGRFVNHSFEIEKDYVCGLCDMPSRAGKTREAALFRSDEAAIA
ncbi:transcriptional regulator FlhC [Betaproteobacteria bacterium GR16-43]|nr:transcriptional regulator FlhC [Betaproteobacteria bacterium GR16-43]